MKVLDFALITNQNKNNSMRKAIASIGDEVYVYDWVKYYYCGGIKYINDNLLNIINNKFLPELIFMQIQNKDILYIDTIKQLKNKGIYIINWTGDVRVPTPQWYKDIGKLIDLTLFTNTTDVDELRKYKITADYLQIGFENEIFTPEGLKGNYPEIVFLGNNYINIFPLSRERIDMVNLLNNKYIKKFCAYGGNWNTCSLSINDEIRCYRSCKIAINQNHYVLPGFSSDRIFRIMGSGAFCLTYHYPKIEKEFKIGKHLDTWHNFDELLFKIDYYLAHEEQRMIIAKQGCEYVHKNCTWDKRIDELKILIKKHKLNK